VLTLSDFTVHPSKTVRSHFFTFLRDAWQTRRSLQARPLSYLFILLFSRHMSVCQHCMLAAVQKKLMEHSTGGGTTGLGMQHSGESNHIRHGMLMCRHGCGLRSSRSWETVTASCELRRLSFGTRRCHPHWMRGLGSCWLTAWTLLADGCAPIPYFTLHLKQAIMQLDEPPACLIWHSRGSCHDG
jgi:hypothetical protein